MEGVDYSYARPSPTGLYAAGKRFAMRYVGPGNFGKHLTLSEAQGLTAAGLSIVTLVEESAQSPKGGRPVGQAHARAAVEMMAARGLPAGYPMYFAIDYDNTAASWPTARDYLAGAGDVIGPELVGVYGEHDVMVWAARDKVASWFFQTYAWSLGPVDVFGKRSVQWWPGNHVEQYRNGQTVAGGNVDLDRSMQDYFGQWTLGGDVPTYSQLQQEIWWSAEFQPPSLAELSRRLRAFYQVGAGAIGSKGDNNHLRGYHRSAAWIKNSQYCTNRTYSVSETPGNRAPGNVDWLCAIDATIPSAQLLTACQRLDVAVRAGRLEKITEWYGNKDGDTQVDGYDNIRNQVASSDPSHLWHLHMSFDRGRADEDHSDVYTILTGEGDDMTPEEHNLLVNVSSAIFRGGSSCGIVVTTVKNGASNSIINKLDWLIEKAEAGGPLPPPSDLIALKATLLDPEVLAVQADAYADEQAKRLAE